MCIRDSSGTKGGYFFVMCALIQFLRYLQSLMQNQSLYFRGNGINNKWFGIWLSNGSTKYNSIFLLSEKIQSLIQLILNSVESNFNEYLYLWNNMCFILIWILWAKFEILQIEQ